MKLKGYTRAVLALAVCCASLLAQTVTSSLVGTVGDPNGKPVADAPITLTDTATNVTRSATTDKQGSYRFADLAPGAYSVTVRAPGFKAQIQTGIVVLTQETHSGGRMILPWPAPPLEINSVPGSGCAAPRTRAPANHRPCHRHPGYREPDPERPRPVRLSAPASRYRRYRSQPRRDEAERYSGHRDRWQHVDNQFQRRWHYRPQYAHQSASHV